MRVVLYLAISVNGYITGPNGKVDWVYEGSWNDYLAEVRKSDIVAIGRRAYELMRNDEFQTECRYCVFTSRESLDLKAPNVEITHDTPRQFVETLKQQKDIKQVLVAGGSKLNTSFLKEKLIDEIYLDVEPYIFGKGLPLFDPANLKCKLKLLGQKKITNNSIQLHYEVMKSLKE